MIDGDYFPCEVKQILKIMKILFHKYLTNMEIGANFEAVKFRGKHNQSTSKPNIVHLNVNSWRRQLPKHL